MAGATPDLRLPSQPQRPNWALNTRPLDRKSDAKRYASKPPIKILSISSVEITVGVCQKFLSLLLPEVQQRHSIIARFEILVCALLCLIFVFHHALFVSVCLYGPRCVINERMNFGVAAETMGAERKR